MIRHTRHGSSPRLLALQSILSPSRRESLPAPSAGVRMRERNALRCGWFHAEAEFFEAASRRPHNGRHQPEAISLLNNDPVTRVPLCDKCYGCGLELAFPPV